MQISRAEVGFGQHSNTPPLLIIAKYVQCWFCGQILRCSNENAGKGKADEQKLHFWSQSAAVIFSGLASLGDLLGVEHKKNKGPGSMRQYSCC